MQTYSRVESTENLTTDLNEAFKNDYIYIFFFLIKQFFRDASQLMHDASTPVLSSPLEAGWKFSMATSMCPSLSLHPSGLTEPGPLVAPFVYANGNVNSDQSDSVFSTRPTRVRTRRIRRRLNVTAIRSRATLQISYNRMDATVYREIDKPLTRGRRWGEMGERGGA